MNIKKFDWKESLKKFKWKERLSCLSIVCGILLIDHLSLLRSSIRDFITSNFYIPLLIVTFLCLILNFRIAAVGVSLGHMLGMIFTDFFGGRSFNSHLAWYIVVTAIIIGSAIAGEVLYQKKIRKKAKISEHLEQNLTEVKTEKKKFKWEER